MLNEKKIAIIGAGQGGQAIAGFLGMKGFKISLWDRSSDRLKDIKILGGIKLTGRINGFGEVVETTCSIAKAVKNAFAIMVVTTADAHDEIAFSLAKYLENNQTIILNPGRTLGALSFKHCLNKSLKYNIKKVYIAEAQSLIFACRTTGPATIEIFGVKKILPIAAFPACDNQKVIQVANKLFPNFTLAPNIFFTSLENIGCIFHPIIVIINLINIESQKEFAFYQTLTPTASMLIEKLDLERLEIGKAFQINLKAAKEWIKHSYPETIGNTLYARIRSNPAYNGINAPKEIRTRLLTEDIPTGLVPLFELAKLAKIYTPITKSIITLASEICEVDFFNIGRNFKNLRLNHLSKEQLKSYIINNHLKNDTQTLNL